MTPINPMTPMKTTKITTHFVARFTARPTMRHAALAACLALPLAALAHGPAQPGAAVSPMHATVKEQKPWGIAGDKKDVRRTVRITMSDTMRFAPERIEVREGQTLRLVVVNRGKLLHELVIGTRAELESHAALMKKHPGMEHDEPYMAHVASGRTGELVWTFNRAGEFEFACLIPGHFEAGMIGRISVVAAPAAQRK
jgi:uncharacterized cupredoxin-like copper-binding protein